MTCDCKSSSLLDIGRACRALVGDAKRPPNHRLYKLAQASLSVEAHCLPTLKVKVELLLEYTDPYADDIVAQLTRSLCHDLLSMVEANKCPMT